MTVKDIALHDNSFTQHCVHTHFRSCFEEVLGRTTARPLLRRVESHYTPKHASWLNVAEIEISIMEYLGWHLMDQATARHEVRAWQCQRNA